MGALTLHPSYAKMLCHKKSGMLPLQSKPNGRVDIISWRGSAATETTVITRQQQKPQIAQISQIKFAWFPLVPMFCRMGQAKQTHQSPKNPCLSVFIRVPMQFFG